MVSSGVNGGPGGLNGDQWGSRVLEGSRMST